MSALPEHVRGWSIPAHESRPTLSVISMGCLYLAGNMNRALSVIDPRYAAVEVTEQEGRQPGVSLSSLETSGSPDAEHRAVAAILYFCAEDRDLLCGDRFVVPRLGISLLDRQNLAVLGELGFKAKYGVDDLTAEANKVCSIASGYYPEFAQAQPLPTKAQTLAAPLRLAA